MSDTASIRPTVPEVIFWAVFVFFLAGMVVAGLFGYVGTAVTFGVVSAVSLVVALVLAGVRLVVAQVGR